MSAKRKKSQPQPAPTVPNPPTPASQLMVEALAKYKELYTYSTDVLLKEHDRFNRADEKASKYSTTFVFLLGIIAYFDKWIIDTFPWKDFPAIPEEWPIYLAGCLALLFSAAGWFVAINTIKLKPFVSRPLNRQMLDFFENQSMLPVYYGLARENSKAYEANKITTDEKYALLVFAHRIVKLILALLGCLVVRYCLYSWC